MHKQNETGSAWLTMTFQIQFSKGGEGGKNREQRIRDKGFHCGILAVTRTATQNEWEEDMKETRKHISILKSFIVLPKSSYYLTRNKDKWQIFYITNARPAHTMALFLHGVEQQIHLRLQTASTNLSPQIRGSGFQIRCGLRLENDTLNYIHLQCWSPQSVISEVPNAVDSQGSMQMGGEVHKSCLGKDALTHCSFEDMRWARTCISV